MKSSPSRISEIVNQKRTSNRPDVTPGKRYLLYGAGRLGRTIVHALKKAGVEVAGFIDQSAATRTEFENCAVHPPNSERVRELYAECDGIIVTIYNHHANLKDIFLALNRLGYQKLSSAPDLARALPAGALWLDYWLDLADELPGSDQLAVHLEQGCALFEDEPSRELFLELCELRLTGNYTMDGPRIHSPDLARQYFPQDLPGRIDARRMIDCGAYDGDSVRAARQFSTPLERVACFEPDPENFRKLAMRVRSQPSATEVELFPLAVWNENKLLSFTASREAGSAVAGDNLPAGANDRTHIQAVTLDDALGNFRPTLIKMDIEGAEPEALQGAARLILGSRPHLAICIYHKLRHYWEIPQLVKSLGPDYRLFLRQHGYNGQETVMYALPSGN
jgi:FkbM family methyltransferase